MNTVQEVFNALTMLPTAFIALHILLVGDEGTTLGDGVLALAILVHFPFSVLYHLHCALYNGHVDPVENNLFLKLDLIFIHVAGSLFSYATSGSLAWLAATAAFNGTSAYRTARWRNTAVERRSCRLGCVLGYILPIVAIDVGLFACTLLAFIMMALPFVLNKQLLGWGHALSHTMLVPFAICLFAAA